MWEHERKLSRAAQHFEQLKAQVVGWEEGQGYTLRATKASHRDPTLYEIRAEVVRPVEDEPFPLVLGDFLQNARAALDYLAGALGNVGAGGWMTESDALATMFPITRSPERFAEIIERRLPTVSEPVRAAIEDLQPYETGGDLLWNSEPLWILNELARVDRHRFLHVGYERIGMLALNPRTSRNVNLTDLDVETGSFESVEVDTLEDAEIAHAEGRPVEDGAMLATFNAVPIDPDEEMHMEWESAIEIGFDEDRLPKTLHHLGGTYGMSVIYVLRGIVPDIREVFRALASFLPAEPPRW